MFKAFMQKLGCFKDQITALCMIMNSWRDTTMRMASIMTLLILIMGPKVLDFYRWEIFKLVGVHFYSCSPYRTWSSQKLYRRSISSLIFRSVIVAFHLILHLIVWDLRSYLIKWRTDLCTKRRRLLNGCFRDPLSLNG